MTVGYQVALGRPGFLLSCGVHRKAASQMILCRALIVYFEIVAELIKKAVCEFNPPENITCPESQMIEVVSANYGRKDKWTCGEQLAENDRCL